MKNERVGFTAISPTRRFRVERRKRNKYSKRKRGAHSRRKAEVLGLAAISSTATAAFPYGDKSICRQVYTVTSPFSGKLTAARGEPQRQLSHSDKSNGDEPNRQQEAPRTRKEINTITSPGHSMTTPT